MVKRKLRTILKKRRNNIEISEEQTDEPQISEKQISEKQKEKAVKLSKKLGEKYSEKKVEQIEKRKNKYFNKKYLSEIWDKIELLWKKLREKETPLKVKIAIFGGFAYMLLPADLIPDVIPGLGFLDDFTVFVYIWKTVVPYLKEVTQDLVEEITTEKIKVILNDTFKSTILRSSIVLLLNICATLIACFHPFGETASMVTASIIFAACLIYSFVRLVKWIVKNGAMAFRISISVIREKSIRRGVSQYIRSADDKVFRQITKVFKFAEVANQMTDLDLPSLEDVIHHYIKKFFKTIILFFAMYWLYVVLVYWLLKPYLLNHYANLSLIQIILYPITHILLNFKATL